MGVESNEQEKTLKKATAALGLATSLVAASVGGLGFYNASRLKGNSIVKEAYDELEDLGIKGDFKPIAVIPEALSANDMRLIYSGNDTNHLIVKNDEMPIADLTFDDSCTYYKVPLTYQLRFMDKDNVPAMWQVLRARDNGEICTYAEIPNEFVKSNAVAVFYPYNALIYEKDRLLSLGRELNEYEMEIVNDAIKIEEKISDIYNEKNMSGKSL